MKVYRLISENSMEERVLAVAQRKLVLDALMIKKGGGSHHLLAAAATDAATDADEGKSLKELWGLLTTGAVRIFDPTAVTAPDLTPAEYDRIIRDTLPGVDVKRQAAATAAAVCDTTDLGDDDDDDDLTPTRNPTN